MRPFIRKKKLKISKKIIFSAIAKVIFVFILIAFIIWSIVKYGYTEFLNVNINWQINESPYISQEKLAKKIQPLIENKYNIDLYVIKKTIEQEPWIKKAHIKRVFWNNINIKVTTQQISMRWGSCCYISTTGELFTADKIVDANLVQADSNKDKHSILLLHKDYKRYQELIKPMVIKAIKRTNIDKLLIKPNINVILGYKMQDSRLLRFVKIYQQLASKNKKINNSSIFDMRYPKGFSLSYQTQ